MLKIEVIKFEAQDVITASAANPDAAQYCSCTHDPYDLCVSSGRHAECLDSGYQGEHNCYKNE